MSDLLNIKHPGTGGTATVSVQAFELAWSRKGFVIDRPEDHELVCEDCEFIAATAGGLATHQRTHTPNTED